MKPLLLQVKLAASADNEILAYSWNHEGRYSPAKRRARVRRMKQLANGKARAINRAECHKAKYCID